MIDDVWVAVGSDNLNRRSWTHDSEVSCAVIDTQLDERTPHDPGGLGDKSRKFARELRISLWAEHLGRSRDDPQLLDPANGLGLFERAANELANPSSSSTSGERPRGRVGAHNVEPVPRGSHAWAEIAYRLVFDPDGRP